MSEIEKMKRYIERTSGMKVADSYCLVYQEAMALFHRGLDVNNGLLDAISLAFDYGKAKGYRAAKAQAKTKEAIT